MSRYRQDELISEAIRLSQAYRQIAEITGLVFLLLMLQLLFRKLYRKWYALPVKGEG